MLESLAAFAQTLADSAGEAIRPYFRVAAAITVKADSSPVTQADRAAESAIRSMIAKHYPSHGIIGEEFGNEKADAEFVWVIDPIDGTRAFIAGKPQFGTLIALLHHGVPVIGVIDQPITGERWTGVQSQPSALNSKAIHTSAKTILGESMLATTSPHYFSASQKTAFERVRAACRDTLYGGDCYAYGLLALGGIGLVVEAGLKPYDYMALIPVISGAGGVITDWQGSPLTLQSDGTVLAAANEVLHKQAIALLQA